MNMNDNDILLSIIVPVYNVEPYVRDCLLSITACDLEDCEIIISVGDSSDGSNQICKEFVRENKFAKMIVQSGKGLSNARNCAIKQAKGRYLAFVDSDDSVDSPLLNELIQKLRSGAFDADVIVTDYRYFDCRFDSWRTSYQIGENTPDQFGMEFLPVMLKNRGGFWNVWRYIYRREFIQRQGLRFLENTMSEDMDFTARVLRANPRIIFTHCPFYLYVIGRGTSLMDRPTLKRIADTEKNIRLSCAELRESDFPYASLIRDRFQYEYVLCLSLIPEFDRASRAEVARIFQKWHEVLADSTDPAVTYAHLALHLLGIRGMGYSLYILKKIKHHILERRLKG